MEYLSRSAVKQSQRDAMRFNPSEPGMPIAVRSANLARYAHRSEAPATLMPVAWFQSTRNLDLCLLAVCSCVLAVLCHQSIVPPAASGGATASVSTKPAQIDLLIKSALFTTQTELETVKDE